MDMTFLPYIVSMNRNEALKIIRAAAKAKGRQVRLNTKSGKGSHAKLYVGLARTIIPNKVSPLLLKMILKQLDLED